MNFPEVLSRSDNDQNEIVIFRNAKKLNNYTQHYDRLVNKELRNKGNISFFSSQIINGILDTLEETPPIKRDYILYRGFDYNIFQGNLIIDPGFMSKTSSRNIALRFSTGLYEGGGLLIIKYPKNTKQLYLSPISSFPEEEEYLTYPGETLRVIKHEVDSDELNIYFCEYIENNYNIKINEIIDEGVEKIIRPFLDLVIKGKKFFWIKLDNLIENYQITNDTMSINKYFPILRLRPDDLYGFLFNKIILKEVNQIGIFDFRGNSKELIIDID